MYFAGFPWPSSKVLPQFVTTIHIRKPFGRFGNQLIQILNALILARRFGSREIIAPNNEFLAECQNYHHIGEIMVYSGKRDITWGNDLPVIRSRGFRRQVHLSYNTFFADHPGELSAPITPSEFDEACDLLRAAWGEGQLEGLPEGHLVIHLRAGDVFSRTPNPLYGQPPLSFYEKVLAMQSWAFVSVVREDERHPLEQALSELLEATSVGFEFRSASLAEDIEFLRSATNLVSSRGTFVPAISCLSPVLKRVFVFGPEGRFHSRVKVVRILDTAQRYWRAVCDSNWENSEAQRNLMASYPSKYLSVARQ